MSRVVSIAAPGVQVTFVPKGDRFAQRIEFGESAWLEAVDEDDNASDSWPPSPPLQDVHLETRPGGQQLALMIGRAGTSHWSISCELTPAPSELLFDVACRIKEPATWLGSRYQLSPGLAFHKSASGGELISGGKVWCRISTESDCNLIWQAELGRLTFVPYSTADGAKTVASDRVAHTIRWRYRLVIDPVA